MVWNDPMLLLLDAAQKITLTLTGQGGAEHYIEIAGVKHYDPGTIETGVGTNVHCYVRGSGINVISLNSEIVAQSVRSAAEYDYPAMKDAEIQFLTENSITEINIAES